MALASAPWILSLDDDECFNKRAIEVVRDAIRNPMGSIFSDPV